MKTAWVFPGQGSQTTGMGVDLARLSTAKPRLSQAQEILGWDVMQACLNQKSELSQTLYTQPCLYVISAILSDLIKTAGFFPSIVAGHSLGEYSALYTARVINFETGLQLVKRRAELMTNTPPGIMVALIGFNRDRLEAAVAQTSNVVIANDNHNGQIVISGTSEGVETLLSQVKVRRNVPLSVSGAFHSPLMAEVSQEFNQMLAEVNFQTARVPVMSNTNPSPTTNPSILKQRLMEQMTSRVRWRETINNLAKFRAAKVLEVGSGDILSKMIGWMYPDILTQNIEQSSHIKMLQQPLAKEVA